jgi:hypothetical protein
MVSFLKGMLAKKTKTIVTLLTPVPLLASLLSVLFINQRVLAAVQGEWVDFATIKVGDQLYIDGNPRDPSHDYYLNNNKGDCASEIDAFEGNKVGATKAKITLRTKDPLTGECPARTDTINLSQPISATIQFYWVDSGTIEGAWSGDGVYKKLANRNDFAHQTNDECKNSIVPSSEGSTTGVLIIRGQVSSEQNQLVTQCGEKERINIRIGNAEASAKPAGSGSTSNGGSSGGGGGNNAPSCESVGGSALAWAICPVIKLLDEAASWLDNQVQSLLVVQDPATITVDGTNQLKQAWSRLRNIALIILVPMMLFMIISTALGFSFVDAYTIKKVMPRFLIAVLFISTSFYLMSFLVNITNDVGRGVMGLITQPFGGADQTLVDLMSPAGAATVSWGGFLVFGGLAWAGLASFGIILSLAFVAVIALAVGFAILMLRQVLILGLLLLAPLAILSWIFPNSVKGWKLWWGTFSKLLLMFPIIMLLIGAGRAFAQIINSTQVGGAALRQVMILLAYIAPFFLIPATFKAAGGVLGTFTGMVNDRTRGLFDRQKKYRQESMARGWERKGGTKVLQARAAAYRKLQDSSGKYGRLGGGGLRFAARTIGGMGLEDSMSAKTAQRAKEINDRIATGKDGEIRGLTALYAYDMGFGNASAAGLARYDPSDGVTKQYKSLGGAWVNEGEILAGRQRWGHDRFAQQAALSYEMKKAITDDQVENITSHYADQVKSWGMSDQEAFGAWIGAGFENQNQHLEFKHTKWDGASKNLQFNGAAMATEIYERRGSYNMAQVNAHTIEQLKHTYDQAGTVLASATSTADQRRAARDTQQKVQSIAETFMYRGGARGVAGVEGDSEVPIIDTRPAATPSTSPTGARAPAEEFFQTNTPGAGHVAEVVRDLAVHVGVYQPDLGSPRTRSDRVPPTGPPGGPLSPPDIPRQN